MGLDQGQPAGRVPVRSVVEQHQGTAHGQQPEDVVHGKIEIQGGHGKRPVGIAHAVDRVYGLDGIPGGGMAHLNALGFASGTRGENHIGRLAWGDGHRGG
jgi:hypothetical protein